MLQLTNRQHNILKYLLKSSKPIPVRQLANEFCFSERTIRYDLDQIQLWLKTKNALLIKKTNSGVFIQMEEHGRAELLCEDGSLSTDDAFLSREERAQFLFYRLLFSDIPMTAAMLADEMRVSDTTVMKDIRYTKQCFLPPALTISGKRGEGYRLSGAEKEIRAALTEALRDLVFGQRVICRYDLSNQSIQRMKKENPLNQMAQKYLLAANPDSLADILASARETLLFTIPEEDYTTLLLYLSVLRNRFALHPLASGQTEYADNKGREMQLAETLLNQLDQTGTTLQRKQEIKLLELWLVACNVKFPLADDDTISDQLSIIVAEMTAILQEYPGYQMPEFFLEKLQSSLLSHLRLTMKKHFLNITSPNALLNQIQANYPEVFAIADRMKTVFEERVGILLNEDETGYIAIHLAAGMEECHRFQPKKALIVCNTGQGVARVLYSRIRNNIPRLEISGTLSALDVSNKEALRGIDFIISTIELPEADIPVFRVSPIINADELEHINHYLNGQITGIDLTEVQKKQQDRVTIILAAIGRYIQPGKEEDCITALKELPIHQEFPNLYHEAMTAQEYTIFQCSMILAAIGNMICNLRDLFDITLSHEIVFGIAIHLLMSLPRWSIGIYGKEYDEESYRKKNPKVYAYLLQELRQLSEEYELHIPDSEVVAVMRYFL